MWKGGFLESLIRHFRPYNPFRQRADELGKFFLNHNPCGGKEVYGIISQEK